MKFKKGFGMIETMFSISIFSIFLAYSFNHQLISFNKSIKDDYEKSVETLVEQQKTIKRIKDYYFEFSFSSNEFETYTVYDNDEEYKFSMFEKNTVVNFNLYTIKDYKDEDYECVSLEVISLHRKSTWNSCQDNTIRHEYI